MCFKESIINAQTLLQVYNATILPVKKSQIFQVRFAGPFNCLLQRRKSETRQSV